MANERLRYIIEAVWQGGSETRSASREIQSVGEAGREADIRMAAAGERSAMLSRRMGELGREVAKGNISVEEANRKYREFESSLADVGTVAQRGQRNLGDMIGSVTKVTAAFGGIVIAADRGYKALKEGADLQLARTQFDRLAESIDTTSDSILVKLRQATRGMATDAQLVESAANIISLGLANTEDGVVRLANVVTRLGLDMQQVILTFANNSTARLDSLGLSIEEVVTRQRELTAAGQDLDSAFDQAVLEALENRVALLGDASETTAGKLQRMEVAFARIEEAGKLALANALTPAIDLITGVALGDNAAVVGGIIDRQLQQAQGLVDLVELGQRINSQWGVWSAFTGTAPAMAAGADDVLRELARVSTGFEEFDRVAREAFSGGNLAVMLRRHDVTTMFDLYQAYTEQLREAAAAQEEVRRTNPRDVYEAEIEQLIRLSQAHDLAAAASAEAFERGRGQLEMRLGIDPTPVVEPEELNPEIQAAIDAAVAQGEFRAAFNLRLDAGAIGIGATGAAGVEARHRAEGIAELMGLGDAALEASAERAARLYYTRVADAATVQARQENFAQAVVAGFDSEAYRAMLEGKLTGAVPEPKVRPTVDTTEVEVLAAKLGIVDEEVATVSGAIASIDTQSILRAGELADETGEKFDELERERQANLLTNFDNETQKLRRLHALFESLPTERAMTLRVNQVGSGLPMPQPRATGGVVTGGIKGVDSVPSLLQPDEVVLPARVTRNYPGGPGALFGDLMRGGTSGGGQMVFGGDTYQVFIVQQGDEELLGRLVAQRQRAKMQVARGVV